MSDRRSFLGGLLKFGAGVTLASTLPSLGDDLNQVVLASPLEVQRFNAPVMPGNPDDYLWWHVQLRRGPETVIEFNQHITGFYRWIACDQIHEIKDRTGHSVVEFSVNSITRNPDGKLYLNRVTPLETEQIIYAS